MNKGFYGSKYQRIFFDISKANQFRIMSSYELFSLALFMLLSYTILQFAQETPCMSKYKHYVKALFLLYSVLQRCFTTFINNLSNSVNEVCLFNLKTVCKKYYQNCSKRA